MPILYNGDGLIGPCVSGTHPLASLPRLQNRASSVQGPWRMASRE